MCFLKKQNFWKISIFKHFYRRKTSKNALFRSSEKSIFTSFSPKIMSDDLLRWVRIFFVFGQKGDFFFSKPFFSKCKIRTTTKLYAGIQLGCSELWQKFQRNHLGRTFGIVCTNLKNFEKIDLGRKNKDVSVIKIY